MRKILALLCAVLVLFVGASCSVKKVKTEKLKDLDFTVVKETEIPEELQKLIELHKEQPMKLTYTDLGVLYIVEGYGKQETSGYSIEVQDCFETENAIYFRSNLIGPSKEEARIEAETFPYIVVKLQYVDKNVVFQ